MKVLLFIMAVAICTVVPAGAQTAVVDGIKSVVANRIVTFSEVQEYTRPAAQSLQRQYYGQPQVLQDKMDKALNDGLEQLVERMLILRSFDTEGYRLPDSVIDELMQERIRQYGDRVTFIKTLQARGMTIEQFRKQIRDQYIESALRNQHVDQQIFVSPYKVETYYKSHQDDFQVEDEVKLQMIVLPKSGPGDTNTIKLAREIEAQIKSGTSFKEMAATYSQGSQQHQGGDWGWVERSVLRKELADVAFSLKPGVVSDPVDTADTCYLMMVDKVRPAHVRPLTEVAPDIEKILLIQEQSELQKKWIDGLKKKTFIRYF